MAKKEGKSSILGTPPLGVTKWSFLRLGGGGYPPP